MAREQTQSAQKGHTSKTSGSRASSGRARSSEKGEKTDKGEKTERGTKAKGGNPDSPAHIQKFLGGVDYPVQKQQLLEKAREQGADKEVMAALEKLPDREYNSPVGVSREIGKVLH